jgi:hypothetical protein
MTKVRTDDPVSVATHAEIELLVSSYTLACDLHHYILDSVRPQLYATQLETLLSLIYAIPSRYDMLNRSWRWIPGEASPTHYYRSIYTQQSDPAGRFLQQLTWSARCTRPVIFRNVTALLAFLKRYTRSFRANLLYDHDPFQYDLLYAQTLSSFEAWMDLARRFVTPSLSRLRRLQEKAF